VFEFIFDRHNLLYTFGAGSLRELEVSTIFSGSFLRVKKAPHFLRDGRPNYTKFGEHIEPSSMLPSFTFQIHCFCCSISKSERIKGGQGRKSRPKFALL